MMPNEPKRRSTDTTEGYSDSKRSRHGAKTSVTRGACGRGETGEVSIEPQAVEMSAAVFNPVRTFSSSKSWHWQIKVEAWIIDSTEVCSNSVRVLFHAARFSRQWENRLVGGKSENVQHMLSIGPEWNFEHLFRHEEGFANSRGGHLTATRSEIDEPFLVVVFRSATATDNGPEYLVRVLSGMHQFQAISGAIEHPQDARRSQEPADMHGRMVPTCLAERSR